MTKAEAIVWLTEAREARESARAAWNYSGDEIKTLEAALDAAKAKNAELRSAYYMACSEVGGIMDRMETARRPLEAHFKAKHEAASLSHAEADLRYRNARINSNLPTKGRTDEDLRAAYQEWQAAEKAWFATLAVLNAAVDDHNIVMAHIDATEA